MRTPRETLPEYGEFKERPQLWGTPFPQQTAYGADTSSVTSGSYSSFSGADIRCCARIPLSNGGEGTVIFANLQTLSYSVFREKGAVRSLGFIGEKGRTRGIRTIAGSMVFTVFDRHVMFDLMRGKIGESARNSIVAPQDMANFAYSLVDQLPPFDIVVQFASEYGHSAEMVLFGVEISAEGQVMSIEDLITENTVQYTAQHMAIMRPGGYEASSQKKDASTSSFTADPFKSILGGGLASPEMAALIRKSANQMR